MSERRLSEIARHLVQPSGITGSDFNLVNRAAVKAGIRYDLWQQGFLYLLLAKREDGRYACGAGGAVLSSCRQIGKTFMIGTAMFILCAGRKGTLVIWTAHHTRTSDETFNDLCELARTPVLARYVDHIRRANGQQEIRFSNGSRIMFGARENGFGRGMHSADIEVFDEAQILTVKALDNLIPIVNTSPNPLVILMGNPPKPGDQSEAFAEKRANAKANPSYPRRTGEDAILRMRNLLAEDSFRREALGIWDETTSMHVIDPEAWAEGAVEQPDTTGLLAFGVDMPPDRGALAIGYAIRKPDGTALVGVEEYRSTGTQGVAWAVEWLAERWAKTAAVVVDAQSPAMSLLPDLKARHVRVTVTQTRDLGAATGRMLDMIRDRKILHLPDAEQPQLAMAVHGATLRDLGPNGAVAWQKKGSDVDISPLQAVTLALHGAYTTKRRPGRKQKVMI